METVRSALPNFFKTNAALLGLILATLALGQGVQGVIFGHPAITALTLLLFEVGTVLVLAYTHRDQSNQLKFDELGGDELGIERLRGRFATVDDFTGTNRVYHEWFKPQLSIHDGEYCKILNRGEFVRIVEADHSVGSQQSKAIVGYYSVWPLSRDTFKRMADGKLRERNVTSAIVLSPSDLDVAVLYVPEVCASKTAWGVVRGPLANDLAQYIGHLLIRFPHIEHVGAWPYTKQGQHHVKRAKMERVGLSWLRKFYWASRDIVLTLPQTRKPFKGEWTIRY